MVELETFLRDGNFPESTQQVRFWDICIHPQILKPMTWGEREFFEQNPVTNLSMYFSRWNCNIYIGRLVLGGVLSKWREPKIRFEKYKWIWIYFILYIHILHNYDDDYDYVMMLIMLIQPLACLVPGWELESKWMFQQRNCWIRGVRNSQNSRITSQTTMALAMK